MQLKTILHPTDFTHSSEPALSQAAAVARDYGTRLLILHAGQLLPLPRGIPSRCCLPVEYARTRQQLWEQLRQVRVPYPEVPVEYLLSEDDPVSAIVRTAAARDCDLIVMGGHGPSGLRGLLTAGVAEQVVRWAHCPVLVIKPAAEVEQALGAKYRSLPAGPCEALAGPFFALPEVRARAGW